MSNFGDPIWENLFSKRDWGKYPSEEVIKFYKNSIINRNTVPKVLDAGSGKGSCTWFMSKEGGDVTAFDGSISAIKNIPLILKEFNIKNKIELVQGDITNPKKYLNQNYDIILDNISLCVNLEKNIIDAYKQYYDLLNNNGDFLSVTLGKKSTGFNTGIQIENNTFKDVNVGCMKNRGMITWFDSDALTKIYLKIGFNIFSHTNIIEVNKDIIVEKNYFHLKK